MIHFIQEIALYMLGAYVVGAVYGWFMHSIRTEHDQSRQEHDHALALVQLRTENQGLRDQINALQRRIESLEETPPGITAAQDWESEYDLQVLSDIEPHNLKRLAEENIRTTRDLYRFCSSEQAIYDLAQKVRVEDFAITRWVSISHLLRVADIDVKMAELLEATEIYSLEDLARQRPARLLEKLAKTNQREHMVERLPSEESIGHWIEHAGHLLKMA